MKKIFYLYILIFLSCDPGSLGLEEESGIYSYHDGLAIAWESFFSEEDTEVAIAYVKSVISETEDEEYYNSAYTALGWLYMFKSNDFIGEPDSIIAYRDSAFTRFSYIENETLAIDGYDEGCYFDFCCSDCFVADREVGLLYNQIEAFFILSEEQQEIILDPNTGNPTYLQALIDQLASFVQDNSDYDFMNGKPIGNNGETMDLAIDDIIIYLSHVYFRTGQFTESCNELNSLEDYQDCELDCNPLGGWNHTNLGALLDCLNGEILF